ncbi:M12 family metallo-peptidase [Flavihumibacter stibioxidans]|uniref:PKD domain-containing protein n=1 Tax=Flavihumibacter stibioxidans TaxID=1834163 RepID=A0ABR7M3E7_9BACT|nr:M12 family metallo-peptidase [Flavihumibacter stibioxidans]MBC6489538.1 hypothetical protein [Flavihumibacter stibioxidans]
MSKFTLRIVLLFFCYIPFQLIAQKKISGKPVDRSKAVSLSKVFKKYSLFSIPTADLYQYTKTGGKQSLPVELDLPGYAQWPVTIHETSLLADDYQVYSGTGAGRKTLPLSEIRTYSGSLDNSSGSMVHLTISGKTIHGFLRTKARNYNIEPLRYFDPRADAGTFVLYEAEDVIPGADQVCGLTEAAEKSGTVASGFSSGQMQTLGSATGDCLMVEMAIASDESMYRKYGSYEVVEEHNISILHMMAGLYSNAQIGSRFLNFKLKGQYISENTWDDPYSETYTGSVADNLLDYFSKWSAAGGFGFGFDLGQVWTARNISSGGSSSVVGLAYMGTVCTLNSKYQLLEDAFSTSLTQAVVAAHETGHNFNAQHDLSTGFVMSSSINASNPATSFSAGSLVQMDTYLNGSNALACLAACEAIAPRADFTASTFTACASSNISFTNISPDAVDQVTWTFPDGDPLTSTANAPVVKFATPGLKTVTMTVSNSFGSSTVTKEIMVMAAPATCLNLITGNSELAIIYSFSLAGIQNTKTSLFLGPKYTDYTCTYNTPLKAATEYVVTSRMGMSGQANNALEFFIDYNNNGDFLDANEQVHRSATCLTSGYNFMFTTPATVIKNTFLRARLVAMPCNLPPSNGCDIPSNAQIEDYSVYFTDDCRPLEFSLLGGCYNKPLTLSGSEPGVTYQLVNTSTNSEVGLPVEGTGLMLDFGVQPIGNYIVRATNNCGSFVMKGTERVIGPPGVFNLLADGICAYSQIRLSGSEKGVYYKLLDAQGNVRITIAGTGAAIILGTAPEGTYTATATNNCTTVAMKGSVTLVAPPTNYTITHGNCAGDPVVLNGSQTSATYQLFWAGYFDYVPVGTPVAGTGAAISLGAMEQPGYYLIRATNSCTTTTMDLPWYVQEPTVWYKDADNDQYSDGTILSACERPAGYKQRAELMLVNGDCDDNNSAITPETVNLAQVSATGSATLNGTDNGFMYGSNCSLIASLLPGGTNPVSGKVNARVWLEPSVPTYSGQPFVSRHYEITPELNAGTATARVTLYFTQQEFDAYNLATGSSRKLPVNWLDYAGIANIRVEKLPGTSNNGTGLPNSYSGIPVVLDPNDADVIWNSWQNRWEISVDVNGFSGFLVHTSMFALPLKLLSFLASPQNKDVVLNWQTTEESNVSHFEIERSFDGISYQIIGTLTARNGSGDQHYRYTDRNIIGAAASGSTIHYRLKMVDIDYRYSYSPVRRINQGSSANIMVYPNPARHFLMVQLAGAALGDSQLRLTDMQGRTVKSWSHRGGNRILQLDVQSVPAGVYQLEVGQGAGNVSRQLVVIGN